MQENEFEKRVQQKMDHFDLTPSPEVWREVEMRIRKEKKRRFVFWWFLGIIALGGGLAVLLLTGKKEPGTTISATTDQKTKPAPTENTIAIPATNDKPVEPTIETKKISDPVITVKSNPVDRPINAGIVTTKTQKKQKALDAVKSPVTEMQKEETGKKSEPVEQAVEKPIESTVVQQVNVDPLVTEQTQIKQDSTKTDILVQAKPVEEKKDTVVTAQAEQKKEKQKKEWDWGISISGGRSSLVNGLNFSNEPFYYSMALGGNTAGLADFSSRRGAGSSIAASVGFFASRPLSKKWDARVGFNYQYLSSRITTGAKVDSSRSVFDANTGVSQVSSFYRVGSSNPYTNRYHLLQLSAEASWLIIDHKKFQLRWDNGISYGQLLGSTMLHYNAGLQGLYKNDRLLNKGYFFLSTGFSLPLSKKLAFNPYASYGLTPVLKNDQSYKANFFNYGIRLRLLLNKK